MGKLIKLPPRCGPGERIARIQKSLDAIARLEADRHNIPYKRSQIPDIRLEE